VAAVAQVAQTQLPATAGKPKPLLRGWFHLVGSLAMLVAGPLIGLEASGTKAELCSAVACFAVWAMLTTSALYHRVHWSDAARRRMRHADHSMIFIAIAGTFTAVAGLSLPDTDAEIVLGLVWGACIIGIVMRFAWLEAPRWAVAVPYIAAGWIAVGAMPEFFHYLGVEGFSLMMAGGLLYTVGAVVYALKRPDPWPRVFGFHEVFHACVVVAAAIHLSLIALVVLPALNS
jgi:hemolysin III